MTDLADVADECIHGLTTAWCSICKAQSRAAEARRRRARSSNTSSWATDNGPLPYPTTSAHYDGLCPSCDEYFREGDAIFLVDGGWCCQPCAEDYRTLGVDIHG